MKTIVLCMSVLLLAVSTGALTSEAAELVEPAERAAGTKAIAAAIAHPGRPAADRLSDPKRKPAEILKFFGIEPGMTVLDFFAGGGYYTELLSRVVGPRGKVLAHNNKAWRDYSADAIAERYHDGRLDNVTLLDVEVDDLEPPPASLDAVVMILAFHDVYWIVDDGSWPRMNAQRLLAALRRGLKPGGVLGVVDHVATAGSGTEMVGSMHRIDPDFVKREILAAGFVLEAESNVLRNSSDDLSLPMMDERVRGVTDRFVYRFRNP